MNCCIRSCLFLLCMCLLQSLFTSGRQYSDRLIGREVTYTTLLLYLSTLRSPIPVPCLRAQKTAYNLNF